MSTITPIQPPAPAPVPPTPAPPAPPAPSSSRTGFAIAALAIGGGTIMIGLIPFVGFFTWPLGIVGVIFGALALRARGGASGLALGGVITAAVSVLTSIALAVGWMTFFALEDATATHTVTYSVTGTGWADVRYATYGDDGWQSHSATVQLPFTTTVKVKGSSVLLKSGLAADSLDWDDTTIACSMSLDGRRLVSDDASGESPTVVCIAH